MAGGMTVEEALAFLNDKKNQEEEERTRKEIEEAERIVEEAKLKGDPVMAMEDGGKLIKEKLKETFQTEDGEIEINEELLTDLEDRYTKLKSSSLNEVKLEKEAISTVTALLNWQNLNPCTGSSILGSSILQSTILGSIIIGSTILGSIIIGSFIL